MRKALLAAAALALLYGLAAAQGSMFPARSQSDDFCFGYAICD